MKVKAAVFRDPQEGPGLETLDMRGPGRGEVLVRMVAAGICHTDMKFAASDSPVPGPVVLGHEGAGLVEAVGPGVTKVTRGDPVVLTFGSCGTCPSCTDNAPAYCHDLAGINFGGTPHRAARFTDGAGAPVTGDFFSQSSFATYAVAQERGVVKVRPDAPLEMLGPLGCGFQTGAGAVFNEFRMQPGQTLAVFGVGAVGLTAVMAAHVAQGGRIVAVDRNAERLELAKELGAHMAIHASREDVAQTLRATLPQGVDFALDTTAALPVMRQAIEVLAPRGVAGMTATPRDSAAAFVTMGHLQLGRSIRGINEGNSDPDFTIPMLVDLFMQGRFPVDRLVRFYDFDQIAEAFDDLRDGTTVKPILRLGAQN